MILPKVSGLEALRALSKTPAHEEIAGSALHAGVPAEIALQFETARNIYLYGPQRGFSAHADMCRFRPSTDQDVFDRVQPAVWMTIRFTRFGRSAMILAGSM